MKLTICRVFGHSKSGKLLVLGAAGRYDVENRIIKLPMALGNVSGSNTKA